LLSIWRFNAHHQMLKSVFFAYWYHFPKENLINWLLICAMSRVIKRNFFACFCNKSLAEWIFESKIKLKKKSEICQFLKKDRDNFVNIHTISLTIKKKALILTEVGPTRSGAFCSCVWIFFIQQFLLICLFVFPMSETSSWIISS